MKTKSILIIALFVLTAFACSKNDDDASSETPVENMTSLFGVWKITSGAWDAGTQYLQINNDNSIRLFLQDDMGFREEYSGSLLITTEQLTVSFDSQDVRIFNYELDETSLSTDELGGPSAVFEKSTLNVIPDPWIQELELVFEEEVASQGPVDLTLGAFNVTYVANGTNADLAIYQFQSSNNLVTIATVPNPLTYLSIAIDKESTDDDLVLASSNQTQGRLLLYESFNNNLTNSTAPLATLINGIATIPDHKAWIAMSEEKMLRLIDYTQPTAVLIETSLNLDQSPNGLAYNQGQLFITANGNVHRAEFDTELRIVETFSLPNYNITGVSFTTENQMVLLASTPDSTNNKFVLTSLIL